MVVDEQCIITLSYELRSGHAKGLLLERMDVNYPFKFYYGSGKLLPAFEQNLLGLEEGQSFSFTLSPEEAYGLVNEANIQELPRNVFESADENLLVKGNYITVTDEYGSQHNGKILSWDDQTVRIDFNHAMAGKTLHFSGVVLNIRPATIDELIRKSYIEEDGIRNREEEDTW